jgi:peptidoglycan/xylan/chitin deacetylase (PgdA/CDA1 family)
VGLAVGAVLLVVLTGALIVRASEVAGLPGPALPPAVPAVTSPATNASAAAATVSTGLVTATVPPITSTSLPTTSSPPAAPAPAAPDPAGSGGLPPLTAPYDTVLRSSGGDRVAYLTFDDGPSKYTGRVLDILAAAGVKATFCQIGSQLGDYPDTERRLIGDGHTLCNHSWTHPVNIAALPPADIDQQIGRTQQAMAGLGVTARYFRAPGGDFGMTTTTLRQICQQHQTRPLGWAVDPQDWKKPGTTAIVQTVLGTITPGAVILLHDGGGNREQTLAALPTIITGLHAQGYTLAALPPDGTG